jgi:hypothetical protein
MVLCLSSATYSQAGYFEGKIVRETKFEVKDSTARAVSFSHMYPQVTIQYFKNGNNLELYDKGDQASYLYLQTENRVYLNKWSKDTLFYFDCGQRGRNIIESVLTENADTLLGYPCDKFQVVYEGGSSVYFFSKNVLKINPAWYKKLTYTNWNIIAPVIKSIALKTVINRADYRVVDRVVSISKESLSDSIFKIPGNAILVEEK